MSSLTCTASILFHVDNSNTIWKQTTIIAIWFHCILRARLCSDVLKSFTVKLKLIKSAWKILHVRNISRTSTWCVGSNLYFRDNVSWCQVWSIYWWTIWIKNISLDANFANWGKCLSLLLLLFKCSCHSFCSARFYFSLPLPMYFIHCVVKKELVVYMVVHLHWHFLLLLNNIWRLF